MEKNLGSKCCSSLFPIIVVSKIVNIFWKLMWNWNNSLDQDGHIQHLHHWSFLEIIPCVSLKYFQTFSVMLVIERQWDRGADSASQIDKQADGQRDGRTEWRTETDRQTNDNDYTIFTDGGGNNWHNICFVHQECILHRLDWWWIFRHRGDIVVAGIYRGP